MECSNTEPTLEAKIQQGRELIIQAPQLFISVDIEADGIAGRGSILEIAGVSPDGQSIFSSLVFPKNQLFIPEINLKNCLSTTELIFLLRILKIPL